MASCPVPAWSTDQERKGLYFEGIVDAAVLDEVLEVHKRDRVSTFGIRSSCRVAEPSMCTQGDRRGTECRRKQERIEEKYLDSEKSKSTKVR